MADKTTIKIFIASSNELKDERERCIFLFNKLGKIYRHLHLEAVEWEYDIAHTSYPEYSDAQEAINKKLAECEFCIFLFHSKIGKYTKQEFELAKELKLESFIFIKKGFSPGKQHLNSYEELLDFIESLDGKVLPIEYSDLQNFEQKLTDHLNLFLSEKYRFPSEERVESLSEENNQLIVAVAEREARIKELENRNSSIPDATSEALLLTLKQEVETIKNNLLQSEEIRSQLAKDKEALEKQLAPQIEHDNLKAKALEEIEKGNYKEAEDFLMESAKASIKETASTFFELAKIKGLQLQYAEAFNYYELAAKITTDNSLYLNEAGVIAQIMGLYDKALQYFERALAIDKKIHGEEHPHIAISYNNIGSAYQNRGEYDKAIQQYEQAMAIDKKSYGEEHPTIAIDYNNIGSAYHKKGEYDKAIQHYEQSLAIGRKFYGEEHPSIAIRYNNIGLVYRNKGEYDKAIQHFERALAIGKKFHGEEHPSIAIRYNNIGLAYRSKGEYDKAIEHYEQALAIDKKFHGEEHPSIAVRYNNIGVVYRNKGEYDKAIQYYEKALGIDKKFHGEVHPDIAIRYNNIGLAYQDKGEYDKAIQHYEKALGIDKKFHGEEHPRIAIRYNNIGSAYQHKRECDKAIQYYEQALAIDKKFHGEEHPDIAIDYNNIGSAYLGNGEYNNAIQFFKKALDILKLFHSPTHPNIQAVKESLKYAKNLKKKQQ